MEVLNEEIASFLESEAEKENQPPLIFGFADIENVAEVELDGSKLTGAVSIGCALSPEALSSLSKGLNATYYKNFDKTSIFVDELSKSLASFIKGKGYKAIALDESFVEGNELLGIEPNNIKISSFSPVWALQRFFATHAGLGWVGKNGLVITKHYGGAVILGTVFTDAPLDCATEVFLSRCGRCKECAIACPVNAIDIFRLPSGVEESVIDTKVCLEECRRLTIEVFGAPAELCGKCIYACPYTKSYIRRKGYPYE